MPLKKHPLDLIIILIWTMLTIIFVLTPALSETNIRTLLGIPMVLFIPGYVLMATMFPKKDDIEATGRIALSLGLSIAVVPLLGLLLNFTFGIQILSILFSLCIYTIVLIFIAAYRREKLPENERFIVPFYRIYDIVNSEINTYKSRKDMILTGALIFSMALAAGMIFFVVTTPRIGERFTEFYILDTSGKAEKYPANLKYNYPSELRAGVINHEYANVNYTLQIALDNEVLMDTWFTLAHNSTWEKNLTFVPDKEGIDMKLEFLLFKDDNFTAPHRALHLWVNVTK